ncbi:hypothetical protein QFZ21_000970 [Microbacterium sp. W4I20]|nr:hypothetical protein [Microbacterium sp. W4I20]
MPLTPTTLTRLDPSVPLLWRDERTLQLGLGGELRVEADSAWVELLLSRMRAGFRRGSFDVIAHGLGAPRDEARALLGRLEHLLIDEGGPARPAWVEIIGITDGRCAHRMREALADEGVALIDRSTPAAVGVVLVQGAAAALQFARYLREDTPHLPVAFESGQFTVGPLVVPGETPCLTCRDTHDTDRDPAWPLLHAQLIGRGAGPITAAQVGEAARLAAQLITARSGAARVVRVSADGSRVWRAVTFHEECRCRARWSPSPRGTATAPALRALPTSTTTGPAFARRA